MGTEKEIQELEVRITGIKDKLKKETDSDYIDWANWKIKKLEDRLQFLQSVIKSQGSLEKDRERATNNANLLVKLIKKYNGPKSVNVWTKYGTRIYWPGKLGYIIVSWDGTLDTTQFYYTSLYPNWKKSWNLAKKEYIQMLTNSVNENSNIIKILIDRVVEGKITPSSILFDPSILFPDFDNKEVPTLPKSYYDLINLDSGDRFTIGNNKIVWEVFGPKGKWKGAAMKTVYRSGTKKRKYYIIEVVDINNYAVGVYEGIGGTLDHKKESIIKSGIVHPIVS